MMDESRCLLSLFLFLPLSLSSSSSLLSRYPILVVYDNDHSHYTYWTTVIKQNIFHFHFLVFSLSLSLFCLSLSLFCLSLSLLSLSLSLSLREKFIHVPKLEQFFIPTKYFTLWTSEEKRTKYIKNTSLWNNKINFYQVSNDINFIS